MNNSSNPINSINSSKEELCQKFWQDVLLKLEQDLPYQQFSTWAAPLKLVEIDGNNIIIAAPNRFKLDFAKKNFSSVIQLLANQYWSDATIQFIVSKTIKQSVISSNNEITESTTEKFIQDTETQTNFDIEQPTYTEDYYDSTDATSGKKRNNKSPDESSILSKSSNNSKIGKNKNSATQSGGAINYDSTKLNKALTFNTFIEGQANMLARSAAVQIATQPNRAYNPCYFYGGVGLGKTHLMHAIGNHFYNKSNYKIRYIHAEQFVSDVVKAYQRKSYDDLKNAYHNLDLLLIDDIQFLCGKTRTQEEFFYVFESLISKKAQIVITSDLYPRELKDIDDRLVSRFISGLLVSIEPPELEMRVAILKSKAALEKFNLDEEVAFFIAKNLASNIRELEGALRKLMAYKMFHKTNIDIDVAKKALKDILPEITSNQVVTIEYIQKIVASFYGTTIADMSSRKRSANLNKPRQIAMFFSKELTPKSLPEIGSMFGGRDHSTILHAIRKVIKEQKTNEQLLKEINAIRQSLS